MRIYADCYELMSELMRDLWEMGHIVHPKSMQNKDVSKDEGFLTKEILNYSYCLKSIDYSDFLFLFDRRSREWCQKEFQERISVTFTNPGQAYLFRKDIWDEFLDSSGRFDYTYNERINPFRNIPLLVDELKRNPDTRQAILSIWDRSIDLPNIGGKKRVPCSIYYQFLIRDNKLHIIYNQRSADLVTHFGNDVYLAWSLKEYMAGVVGVESGYLYHNIASLHSYQKDWGTLTEGISKFHTSE